MGKAKHYQELLVWQKAMDIASEVYDLTRGFPNDERYGLVSQMRRAAVSIASNIAEGHARESTREFLRFLSIALGSLAELETQLLLSTRFGYIDRDDAEGTRKACDEEGRMLRGLQKSLRAHLRSEEASP